MLIPCWRVRDEYDAMFNAETIERRLNLVWVAFDLIYSRNDSRSFKKLCQTIC